MLVLTVRGGAPRVGPFRTIVLFFKRSQGLWPSRSLLLGACKAVLFGLDYFFPFLQ